MHNEKHLCVTFAYALITDYCVLLWIAVNIVVTLVVYVEYVHLKTALLNFTANEFNFARTRHLLCVNSSSVFTLLIAFVFK